MLNWFYMQSIVCCLSICTAFHIPVAKEEPITDFALLDRHGRILSTQFVLGDEDVNADAAEESKSIFAFTSTLCCLTVHDHLYVFSLGAYRSFTISYTDWHLSYVRLCTPGQIAPWFHIERLWYHHCVLFTWTTESHIAVCISCVLSWLPISIYCSIHFKSTLLCLFFSVCFNQLLLQHKGKTARKVKTFISWWCRQTSTVG